MKKLTKILALSLALCMVLALCACGGAKKEEAPATDAPAEAAPAEGASKGKLTMATKVDFPPYEYYDDETGEATGIDVELVKMACEKIGYEVEVVDMDFGSVVSGVATGKYDIGAGAITITEERKQSVDFATPYETTVQMIITLKGSELTEGAQLEAEGASYKIAVQQDTTGDYYASDLETAGKATVERYKSAADAVLALTSGKVDCVVVDGGPAAEFVARDDTLTTFESACTKEEYGFCFAKDNTELFEAFDAALKEMLADGTVDAVFAKYKG